VPYYILLGTDFFFLQCFARCKWFVARSPRRCRGGGIVWRDGGAAGRAGRGGGGGGKEEETWRENAFYAHNFVLRCVVEQHVEARMALEESAGKTLVYCAADDAVWGIARSISDPARFLPSRWGGRNELGKSMMAVRAEISGGSPSVPPKQLQLFTQLLE